MRVALGLVVILLVVGGGWLGRAVPFSEQWPLFEALRTTAAIIFAVIGAWLAIIYPDRLKLSFRGSFGGQAAAAPTGWGQLFVPVVHSTGILSAILILGVIAPLLKAHSPNWPVELFRGCSYAVLVALTIWQLWTVLLTLVPADRVKSYLDREDGRQEAIDAFRSVSGNDE